MTTQQQQAAERIAALQAEIETLKAVAEPALRTRYIIEVLADETSYPDFARRVRDALDAAGMEFDGGYTAPVSEQPRTWLGNPLLDEEGYDRYRGEYAILSVGRNITREDTAIKGNAVVRIGDYESYPITNAKWSDIVAFVDASVAVTGDEHHIFVEGIYKSRVQDMGAITVYNVSLGS